MIARSTQYIWGAVLVATCMAVVWFEAPVIPAVIGGLGTGLALSWRARRAAT